MTPTLKNKRDILKDWIYKIATAALKVASTIYRYIALTTLLAKDTEKKNQKTKFIQFLLEAKGKKFKHVFFIVLFFNLYK